MKSSKYRFKFNENTANLAALSPDGRLKVWETTNGNLCHDWTPPVGLKATCSCLCWVNNDNFSKPPRPKKAKKNTVSSDDSAKFHILLGTVQGSILLLNYGLLEVENKLVNEHKEKINDICYSESKETVYSGSNDKYIVEWSYPSIQMKSKWKADKHSVQKLEVSPDGSCILSAGRIIKLWSIESKQLLQKFTGHSSPVTKLLFAPMTVGKAFMDECYFLSISEDDQMINAWHHDPSSEDKNAVCCFMAGNQPVSIDISLKDSQQLKLAAACLDGKVSIFTHVLNGKLAKPLDSSLSVQLVKSENEKTSNASVKIFAVKLLQDDILLLVYGSPVNPTFEKMKLTDLINGAKIKRETSKGMLRGDSMQAASKSKEKSKADRSTVADANVPLHIEQNRQLATAAGNSTFDKEREELTLGERLTAVAEPSEVLTKNATRQSRDKPVALSVTQMLAQALHSDDNKMIDNVLSRTTREAAINRTLKRLPRNYVLTLINKIIQRVQKNPAEGYKLTIWLRVLMSTHMTYLLSMSAREQSISTQDINESALVIEDTDESDDDDERDVTEKQEELSSLSDYDEGDEDVTVSESEDKASHSGDSDNEKLSDNEENMSINESEM